MRLVKEKYCDELKFANNVGDLVDELAMQHYIIVPALSAVDPKIDPLEALLASAVAKQVTLKAQHNASKMKILLQNCPGDKIVLSAKIVLRVRFELRSHLFELSSLRTEP